jgi:hypothetical protein
MALVALLAFLLLPAMPTALASIVPITETWILIAAALAVCAALGWWNGGGAWLAALAAILGAISTVLPAGRHGSAYGVLVHGWTLLLVASFGVASLLTPGQRFLSRALAGLGIAVAAAFTLGIATPTGLQSIRNTALGEYNRRTNVTVTMLDEWSHTPAVRRAAARNPAVDSVLADNVTQLRSFPEKSVSLLPALLALESLAALAIAWATYSKIARTAPGPRLGALRDFRFNDQLIWGLAVGATIYFLPVFADGRDAGLNLLVFFGALYLLRGVGVLSWVTRQRWVATILIVLTIFVPELVGALALGVGVGDTWMDWRNRAPSAT